MQVTRGVEIAMRDGVVLRADVYRPDAAGPVPVIVLRTPYDRSRPMVPPSALDPERAVEAGFALVCQDTRGRHGSDGDFYVFAHEGDDTYDTIEWAAAQPWATGAVGMAGRSYAAAAQWQGAVRRPPHLKAIAPVVTGSDYFRGWVYQGGAFELGFNLFWTRLMLERDGRRGIDALYRHLPLSTMPGLAERPEARFFFDWIAHDHYDDYWQDLSPARRITDVAVPAFCVGGWYDMFLGGTLENYTRLRREGATEAARTRSRLLVGPWAHGSTYNSFPDHSFACFSPHDAIDLTALQLQFFAGELRGDGDTEPLPAVRLFVMGANRWRDEAEWPLARARPTAWYLHSDGDGGAEGRLSPEPPEDEPPDVFEYDPSNPAPTLGGPTSLPAPMLGTNSGPRDQRPLEQRPDVLVYSSAPLVEPLEVTGPVTARIAASTTARDADIVVKLCDVAPDGQSTILAEGVLRGRFRDGDAAPRPVVPGAVYAFDVDLAATSNVFLAGHRVRVLVTGSSFPRFDRNTGTGNRLGVDGPSAVRGGRQTVFHDAQRPSWVTLPVVPRATGGG